MPPTAQRVLVLGAYGFFGSRICAALARNPAVHLILAGRDLDRATALAYQLGLPAEHARKLDATDARLALQLRKLGVRILIHTAGPFQQQRYQVAQAAIEAGCHYLDLADGRAFVAGFSRVDAAARAANVSAVTGVSSLPALTAAVVDRYLPDFSRLESIRTGISSGALVPGMATVSAVFDYCGQQFLALEDGKWIDVYGWLDRRSYAFPRPVGVRLFGRCDVPDLDLLPVRYRGVKSVSFHAGFVSDTGQKLVELLAKQVRSGRLKSARPFAKLFFAVARRLQPMLPDSGGMFIELEGRDVNGAPLELTWMLLASENHGPHIPCGPAIALTNKIVAGWVPPAGAMPCMGLLTVEEILEPLKGLRIREVEPQGAI